MLHATNYLGPRTRQIAASLALAALPFGYRLAAKIDPSLQPVSIYLNVEKDGNLVTGLAQGNFRLQEDGNARPFRLEPPEQPASIAVLVEYSNSSAYFLDDMDAAIKGFAAHAPEGHWYALGTFSRNLTIDLDFTKQTGLMTNAYANLAPPMWSEINTYDAVYEMLDKLGRLPGRRILILIGSGIDTFSEHSLDDVRKKIETENVTVFSAGLGSSFRTAYEPYIDPGARMRLMQAQAFLQMLAAKSGGFAWFPNHFNGFPSVLEGIFQSIGTQYRLVYETPARGSGKFHKVKVEAFRVRNDKREDFKVLVREGWR